MTAADLQVDRGWCPDSEIRRPGLSRSAASPASGHLAPSGERSARLLSRSASLVPVLLGGGISLFGGLGERVNLERVETAAFASETHLRYRVVAWRQ